MKTTKPNLFIENIKKAFSVLRARPLRRGWMARRGQQDCLCPLSAFAEHFYNSTATSIFKNEYFRQGFTNGYDGFKLTDGTQHLFKDSRYDPQRRAYKRGYLLGLRTRKEIPPVICYQKGWL